MKIVQIGYFMNVMFIILKYIFIGGLTAVSVSLFAAAVGTITKKIKSGLIFFSTAVIFFFLFLSVLMYQSRWQLFCKDYNIRKSIELYDKREWLEELEKDKGDIFDRMGRGMAFSVITPTVKKRVYPFGAAAGHLTGYSDLKKGRTGIEDCFHSYLLGEESSFLQLITVGNHSEHNLYLTIDAELQIEAYDALKGRCGAVVAVVPKTGEVLAMVSSPRSEERRVGKECRSRWSPYH